MEFNIFYDNNFAMLRSVFEDFNEATDCLDNFWFDKAKISSFKTLAFVVKLALTLFHGQASVERKFSISNSVHNNKMKKDTIMAKQILLIIYILLYKLSQAKAIHYRNKQRSVKGCKKSSKSMG